jgi:type I restriction enzyme R subunit
MRGLDTAELFVFLAATQPQAWERLVGVHGGAEGAHAQFTDRLSRQLDERGAVDVLRHGVSDHGIEIRLAFFKPAHGLAPALTALFDANRLTVTRQLPYDADTTKTIDLALFVNGIPVATAELKNPLTNQTVQHAMDQYRTDRDPANVTLGRRAVVHFAVDPEVVMMTTQLSGQTTRFLPFNLGSAGGAGNPPNPEGHRTSYLWERVWARDAWLDLLGRFVHVVPAEGVSRSARLKKGTTIFPRYHQWDAVTKIEATARAEGPGHVYLVQHSAGSGKSNTIAWLSHRLMSLHGADDVPVFDKVVVITDRVILDRQLQETIYQFEHATGVVARIDQDSTQLALALSGEQARIIITTLQKFPYVLDKVAGLGQRRYAVIVDEAHSSQTGEAAKDLKAALGSTSDEARLEAAERAEAIAGPPEPQDALAAAVANRGRQPNLSFFAFTATPKARTLEIFGRPGC